MTTLGHRARTHCGILAASLSKLAQLLSYLERPGVTELSFRSGAPAVMRSGNRFHPITVTPLQAAHIQRFFEGTPVLSHLPRGTTATEQSLTLELLGTPYAVTVIGSATSLEIRVGKPGAPRASTWTDLPAAEAPEGMGRRSRRARADEPASREPAPAAPAIAPEWIIERNDGSDVLPGPNETLRRSRADAIPLARIPSASHPVAASPPTPRVGPSGIAVHPRLRELLVAARQQSASDLHVMSNEPVRVRRAGALEPQGPPVPAAEVEAMAASLLQPAHAAQLDALGYADLGAAIEGAGRMRVNVSRQRTGLKLCLRLVVLEPPSLDALGLPLEVRGLTKHHQGLVIIAGPNGHGKTTTMAALVDLFNAGQPMHIITVEDPVEVVHPRKQAIVTQREVGTHTRSFARALAAALREDPDVIAIGELRDRETVEMALSASETGHLVLATMSTPSAAKTIDRLIDMFPPDDQAQVRATLAGSLKLVLSQRLVRRADGTGLVAAFEMITGGIPLWSLVRDDKLYQLPSLLQRGRNFGMIALEDSLRELLANGVITHDEALAHADDPKALARGGR